MQPCLLALGGGILAASLAPASSLQSRPPSALPSRPPPSSPCPDFVDMSLEFVAAALAPSCRPEAAQAALKSKLRGKKLLLERATTVALGETRNKRASGGGGGGSSNSSSHKSSTTRAARRQALLEAASQVTYEQLLGQHEAWIVYAREAPAALAAKNALPAAGGQSALFARLDWHGARLRVVRSACPSHASAEGLVLAETRRMLLLLNATRRAWVPKAGTLVEITMPSGGVVQCEATRTPPAPS